MFILRKQRIQNGGVFERELCVLCYQDLLNMLSSVERSAFIPA